jgi:hypothetical protein
MENEMKQLIAAILATFCVANFAFADASCEARAAEKKLAGAAKNSFMKKCEADVKAAGTPSCEARATEKKLAGAAKSSFMKKCETESAAAPAAKGADANAACEAKAAEKKLAGAAKGSFVKKCVADAVK